MTNLPAGWNERRKLQKAKQEPRNKWLRELSGEELEKVRGAEVPENEYVGEVNKRQYWAQMNPKELDFQATFDPWAEVELRRRKGELPR
jgi:hypothetical protein